jgi:hypothetical protein
MGVSTAVRAVVSTAILLEDQRQALAGGMNGAAACEEDREQASRILKRRARLAAAIQASSRGTGTASMAHDEALRAWSAMAAIWLLQLIAASSAGIW